MAERVLAFARDGRTAFPAEELLALERVQAPLGGAALVPRHLRQRPEPEDLAEHGRVLDQLLLVLRKSVEAGGDDPLDTLR